MQRYFGCGRVLEDLEIEKLTDDVINTIKNGLVEEARTYEIVDYILKRCLEKLKHQILK